MPIESCANSFGHFRIGLFQCPLCDFSTYWDGAKEVKELFVTKAPLRMDIDELTATTANPANLKGIDWESSFKGNILFSELEVGDKYYRHTSSTFGNCLFSVGITTGGTKVTLFLRDSGNVSLYNKAFNVPGTELNDIFVEHIEATNTISLYIDGALFNSDTYTTANELQFDEFNIAFQGSASINHTECLLSSYSLTGIGSTPFISNQDDGLFFPSDGGEVVWTLTEDIAGSAQIKPDGTSSTAYSWPITSLFIQPATAGLKLREDIIKASFTSKDLADGTTRTFRGVINIDPTVGNFDAIFDIGNSANANSSLRLLYNAGFLQCFWTDDFLASKATTGIIAVGTDTNLYYEVTASTSELTLSVNGVAATPDITILGGVCNVDEAFLGARADAAFNIPCRFDWFFSDCTGYVNLKSRLPTQTDPTGNTFTSSISIVFTLSDFSPFGSYYPHIGQWPTVYLISDTPCENETGRELVLIDGLAQYNILTGLFEFIATP